jgi:CHASE3 domain sensor protein
MENHKLVEKFTDLQDQLASTKIKKAKTEQAIESYEGQKEKVLDKVEKIAGTRDIPTAKKKLEGLEKKLSQMLEEAEEIINA